MRIKNYWMVLAIVLTGLCTVGCGGGDDDDIPSNGGGKVAGSITCSADALSFSSSEGVNSIKTKTGVSGSGGTINVSSSNDNYCTASYSNGTITITRVSTDAWSATITVGLLPDANHIAPPSVTFSVSADAVSMYTMVNAATTDDIGKVICSNGHIHITVGDVDCDGTASAMIAYVGDLNDAQGTGSFSSSYNHGLAVALSDVLANGVEGSFYMLWEEAVSMPGHYKRAYPSSYTSPWLLPSANQLMRIFIGCGSTSDFMPGLDARELFDYGNFRTKMISCGGTDVKSEAYWTSTEHMGYRVWFYSFVNKHFGTKDKDNTFNYARPILAF